MGHIRISRHALWPEKCWSHLPACHDTLLPWPHSHHVGLSWQPHCVVAKANTTHRWLVTSLLMMSQVWNLLEPFQVCFLCPNGPSPSVHHVTQRNDRWSLESPNHFPSNVTSLSDISSDCNIVLSFFVLQMFSKWVLFIVYFISPDGSYLGSIRWICYQSKNMVSKLRLGCMGHLLPIPWVDPYR